LLVTLTFDDLGGKTKLLLVHSSPDDLDPKMYDDMKQGWNESIDKLEAFLRTAARTRIMGEPGSRDIVSTRVFDAPRETVFLVMNDPVLIPMWWGPRRLMTIVERMDLRPGGTWRFLQRDADGNEYAFHGEYREVVSPARIVQTFEYEGMPGHVAIDTTTFESLGWKTLLTTISSFQTVEDRDRMLVTGAEEGTIESNDRIGELLAGVESRTMICTRTGCSTNA
jgi:uncharacterized protein YndB with AHSA1/START domain